MNESHYYQNNITRRVRAIASIFGGLFLLLPIIHTPSNKMPCIVVGSLFLVYGLCITAFMIQNKRHPKPVFTVSAQGVTSYTGGNGKLIPWNLVRDIYLRPVPRFQHPEYDLVILTHNSELPVKVRLRDMEEDSQVIYEEILSYVKACCPQILNKNQKTYY